MGPILKRVGLGVGLATLVVFALGFLLPAQYSVSRTVTINASPDRIHTFVGDLEQWPQWAPLVQADPTIKISHDGQTSGVGAHQTWTGDSNSGELTFTRTDPTWGLAYDMTLSGGKHPSQNTMEYKTMGDSTVVSWVRTGHNGINPFKRALGMMMDPMLGPMFEEGLNRLKLIAEKADEPIVGVPLESRY